MRTTIDEAGRLVVPKAGPIEVDLTDEDGIVVAVAREPVPTLTAETVQSVQDATRRRQPIRT